MAGDIRANNGRFLPGTKPGPGAGVGNSRSNHRWLTDTLKDVSLEPSLDPRRAARGETRAHDVARHLFHVASNGKGSDAVQAARMIFDRLEGKVPDRVEVAGGADSMTDAQVLEVIRAVSSVLGSGNN